jgi:hypothetical protein
MDNHSLVTADRTTHLKIAAIAVIATFVVVVVGFRAHLVGTGTATAGIDSGTVIKAGKPKTFTSRDDASIR